MAIKFGADISYFLWSVGTGLIFAVLYDLIRAAREVLKLSDFWINLTDIIILMGCGFGVVTEAYFVNNGELRIYSILCLVFVFVLYRLIMGEILRLFFEAVIVRLTAGIRRVIGITLVPLRLLWSVWVKLYKRLCCIKGKLCDKINIKAEDKK